MVSIFMYSCITERYSVSFRIQAECGKIEYSKIRTRKNSIFGHFSRSGSYLDLFYFINFRAAILNLFLCDLFLFVVKADIMSYADDNTPYACSKNCDFIRETLEEVGKSFFKCFQIFS